MQTIQDIFSHFRLNDRDIEIIGKETKLAATDCARKDQSSQLSPKTWLLLDNISDRIWNSTDSAEVKLKLNFQAFDQFPSYFHFLMPVYYAMRDKKMTLTQDNWQKFMDYLAAEAHYADPVGYVLWVAFFADATQVTQAWNGLVGTQSGQVAMRRLLEQAGPVPYELKSPVYVRLASEKINHASIFASLRHSVNDAFGQVDRLKALSVLESLDVDIDSHDYQQLKESLA